MTTPRLLAIHDMCSFGRCSLTAAIPTLSAMGIQVCPFPTAIFSNNMTYKNIDFVDFSAHMTKFMDIWQQNGYEYDAIYSGFLANASQIAIVEDAIERFSKEGTLVVADTAMADDGVLYPVFDATIVQAMRHIISIHQQGQTDFETFCQQAADAGVHYWRTDAVNLACIYVDMAGQDMVNEPIPDALGYESL